MEGEDVIMCEGGCSVWSGRIRCVWNEGKNEHYRVVGRSREGVVGRSREGVVGRSGREVVERGGAWRYMYMEGRVWCLNKAKALPECDVA